MAAPVTHLVCAEQLATASNFTESGKSAFLVGTSFPDIRYLGVIDRDQTHPAVSVKDLKDTSSPFHKGRILHLLVDIYGEEEHLAAKLYDFLPPTPYCSNALKFVEDLVLHHSVGQWERVASALAEIQDQEFAYGITAEALHRWHSLIGQYIVAPSNETRTAFIMGTGRTRDIADHINTLVTDAYGQEVLRQAINNWYDKVVNRLALE